MTRSLRQQHRRVMAALAVFLPVAFATGLAVRKPLPDVSSLPAGLAAMETTFGARQGRRNDLFAKPAIPVRLFREATAGGRAGVGFEVPGDFAKPDVMVYWTPGRPAAADRLPENAILLGAFSSTAILPLPEAAARTEGALVLYSLADDQIVAVSKPVRFDGSTF